MLLADGWDWRARLLLGTFHHFARYKNVGAMMQLFSNQQNDIRRLEVENKTLQVELGRLNVGLQAIQEQLCQSENSFQHAKVESIALQQDMLKSCQNTTIQYETGHRAIDTRYEGLSLRKVKQNRHRSCTIPIDFPRAFASTPKVTLGLTMVDTNTNAYTRVRLAVKSVGKDHFVAELLTWSDSVVYAVEFDWVATNLGS
jgi:H-type lectin domain